LLLLSGNEISKFESKNADNRLEFPDSIDMIMLSKLLPPLNEKRKNKTTKNLKLAFIIKRLIVKNKRYNLTITI
jgi:hypothetical protein